MPNIYLTINNYNKDNGINPWRYIGSDQFDNDDYFGSSVSLKEDMYKIGKDQFTKIILEKFDTILNKDLRFKEADYLKSNNVKIDATYYNLTDCYAPAGGKKGMKHSKKFPRSQKWIDSRTGWTPSDSTRERWVSQRTGRSATKETKEKMSSQRRGENNHNALEWKITSPDGIVSKVKGLRAWCIENNLSYTRIYASKDGWKTIKYGAGKGGRKKNER